MTRSTFDRFARITSIFVVLLFIFPTLPACFGRTGAEGLGLVDGEEGASCTRDAQCQFGLVCLRGVCGRVGDTPAQDASLDDGGGANPSRCEGFSGYVELGDSVDGTTVDGENRYSATCGGGRAPEDVWVLELDQTTDLTITTLGSNYDTVLYIRDFCGDGPELACNDDTGVGTGINSGVTMPNTPAGAYYIYVDGWSENSGEYVLNVLEANSTTTAP